MGPALVMAETRACLRTLAQSHDDVGEMLTRANRLLAPTATNCTSSPWPWPGWIPRPGR